MLNLLWIIPLNLVKMILDSILHHCVFFFARFLDYKTI